MPARAAKRLLIVGWDAADWKVIDPLLARGKMPALAGVLKGGVRADLATLEPKLSPILWTSIATGKTADKHGILNFVEPDSSESAPPPPSRGGVRISASTSRKTRALWNILTQAGLRVNVVSWYASHPAEPINGVCISNLFLEGLPAAPGSPWPIPRGAVHPVEMGEVIGPVRRHPAKVRPEELLPLVPQLRKLPRGDRRLAALIKDLARGESVHGAASAVLGQGREWDCTMVFYSTIDVVGHHFMQYHPPRMRHVAQRDFEFFQGVMAGTYRQQDEMLGELLGLAGPDTTVIVLSDHGFHSDHLRPPISPGVQSDLKADAAWHRALGVLAMAGPGIKRGATVHNPTLLDIAPTALALLGLPAGADMDGRALTEGFEKPEPIDRIASWDAADAPGAERDAGLHPADLRQDPFEAREAVMQLMELGYLAPLKDDAAALVESVRRETRFNLAMVYMTTRRRAEAVPLLEELCRAAPDESRYAMSLAQCYSNLGRAAEARAVLAGYLERHPGEHTARMSLGAALLAEGRAQEASDLLEEVERGVPSARTDLDCLLGTVYFFLRRPEDARRLFARAAAADRHSAQAKHGLALAALGRERFEEAVEHALDALGLQAEYAAAHYTLGAALAWGGDLERAIRSFGVALSLQPGMIEAHRFLAAIYRRRGEAGRAEEHERVVEKVGRASAESAEGSIRAGPPSPPMGAEEWVKRAGAGGRASPR